MIVAKILGAFLLTLILGMSFGAINTAEAKKDRDTPGRRTLKCPGPAHWRLPKGGCIKKRCEKARCFR